ncbi:FecCD family ABC transporter permease [Salinibacillus xinjiangensis]|uniref:Iron chelate uptake ABC transporter family permease subunit n=1 Tax=Salinibacillus xinjiangensis TaxID=1229268 RepID=A0A6G1X8J8_9BACI|nr:iron ABC transporter permease [Salinibacillus xinjiangensis]MRG87259.1 iron chelate uptake ABC transporter family permease subunit [Salinibacillus xinjiangensis]
MTGPNQHRKKLIIWIPILLIVLFFSVLFSVSVGSAEIDVITVWLVICSKLPWIGEGIDPSWKDSTETIIWNIRMPRIVLGMLVGSALATAGAIYQGVLRNPLADPFILGVSSGSALGAALVFLFGWHTLLLGKLTLPVVAFVSGLFTLFIVYVLARINHRLQMETLILAGVVVQAFISSMLSLTLALAEEKMQTIMYWMMGSLTLTDWSYNGIVLPFIIVSLIIVTFLMRELNMLGLGEEAAYHTGVSVQKVRLVLLIVASLLTGAAVSVSGTIGFVGLIIPHMIRLIFGSDYRVILPLSVIGGAIFLVGADMIARTILEPRELPIGIITAFLGAPFFGYLLRKKKTNYF